MNKLRAWIFVYLIRPFMRGEVGELRDCPMCGLLLQKYPEGWLHMADGDADCHGALGIGKG